MERINFYSFDTFSNVNRIAKGAFAKVYRASFSVTNASPGLTQTVALKCFDNSSYDSWDLLIHELKIIQKLSLHDNVSKFYGITQDLKNRYLLVLEYANGGTLRQYLSQDSTILDWSAKIGISKQIAHGLSYIHGNEIVHRDLHSKNILIHDGIIKIADFGLSKSLSATSESLKGGMAGYTDPRYLENQKGYRRGKPSDIYSLGVIFWEISSGKPPFTDMEYLELSLHIINDNRESPIYGTPLEYVALYSYAWHKSVERRPNIQQIEIFLNNIRLAPGYGSNILLLRPDDTLKFLFDNNDFLPS